jgi:hypothetical protein
MSPASLTAAAAFAPGTEDDHDSNEKEDGKEDGSGRRKKSAAATATVGKSASGERYFDGRSLQVILMRDIDSNTFAVHLRVQSKYMLFHLYLYSAFLIISFQSLQLFFRGGVDHGSMCKRKRLQPIDGGGGGGDGEEESNNNANNKNSKHGKRSAAEVAEYAMRSKDLKTTWLREAAVDFFDDKTQDQSLSHRGGVRGVADTSGGFLPVGVKFEATGDRKKVFRRRARRRRRLMEIGGGEEEEEEGEQVGEMEKLSKGFEDDDDEERRQEADKDDDEEEEEEELRLEEEEAAEEHHHRRRRLSREETTTATISNKIKKRQAMLEKLLPKVVRDEW